MISFFIDTSTSISTIALLRNNKLINKKAIVSNHDLSSNLFQYIVELFDEVSIDPKDVKKIYAGYGPGSFTGIRIGLTVAKIYAYSLNIEVVPISSLEILASTAKDEKIISMIDARRGYVYAGGYDSNLNCFFKDAYIDLECLKQRYPDAIYVSPDSFAFPVLKPNIDIEKTVSNHDEAGIKAHELNPNYLKITEAEANLNEKGNI